MKKDRGAAHNCRSELRVSQPTLDLLKQRSKDEGMSQNELVNKALALYLTKDVLDESLLIAKMNAVEKTLGNLEKRIELEEKLALEFYQWFFIFTPDIPVEKEARKNVLEAGTKKTQAMLHLFRSKLASMPSFLEILLGNMLEQYADG
ncbi:MAG: hypothetical protein LBS97_01475 [Treponema sp.]|jgi:hypothetical protein|nr:hypothetical protein [Treponema sp.]